MNIKELYPLLVCAISHNISTCDRCGKCEGEDTIEKRMNLIRKLAECVDAELPWTEVGGYVGAEKPWTEEY